MKNTKRLLNFLGISRKTAYCKVEEICMPPKNVGRDQTLQTTQLDDGFVEPQRPLNFNKPTNNVGRDQALQATQLDDGFFEPQRPLNFNKPLTQLLSTRDVIPHDGDIEEIHIPIEVRKVVKHATSEDTLHETKVPSGRTWKSPIKNLAEGAFGDEPQLPEVAGKALDKTMSRKRGKLRKLKKAVGRFVPSAKVSTKVSKVSPSTMVDDVTTLNVLNGNNSGCAAVERLQNCVAMFYV